MERKYKFSWNLLGNLDIGRPNLGPYTRVEVYRLMQFTFRDVLEKKFGTEVADELFFGAGKLAGESFYDQYLAETKSFNELAKVLQDSFEEMKIGVLRIKHHRGPAGSHYGCGRRFGLFRFARTGLRSLYI